MTDRLFFNAFSKSCFRCKLLSWQVLRLSRTLLERSWDDHDRSSDRLDDFGPPLGRFWTLWQSILSIRSSILGSQRLGFGISARYACDNASNIEFQMIGFRLTHEILHETRNAIPHSSTSLAARRYMRSTWNLHKGLCKTLKTAPLDTLKAIF